MQRSRRAVLALLTLLVAWGVGATSAQADGWLPGPTLTDSLRELPQVAVGPDGSAVVVAVEGVDAASAEVVARRIAPDGTASAALMLGGTDVLDVAATTGGGTVVVWFSLRADESAVDVRATTLDAAGTPSPIRNVTTLPGDLAGRPVGAVAPDGAVSVAWAENDPDEGPALLRARRIAADGAAAPIVELGRIHSAHDIQLVVSGDGVARLLWPRPRSGGGGEDVVARIDPAGAASEIVLLTGDVVPDMPRLVAGADGAIAAWQTLSGPSELALRAARLPSGGDVVAAPVTLAEALEFGFNGFDLTLAPGGTATFAWTAVDSEAMVGPLVTRRLAADGSLGPIQALSTPPSERLDILPLLANGADGTVLTTWLRGTPLAPAVAFTYGSRVIGAGGAAVGDVLAVPLPVAVSEAAASTTLTTGAAGDGLLVSFAPAPGGGLSMLTARYDAVPATRPIPQPDPPVPGPVPSPAPRPGPGTDPRPPVVRRAAARLKLTKALRAGARVTVAGTLDRRASGRVTIAWKQKVGRRTVRRTTTARIARGRFSATLRLPRALARARTAGRLTVTYRGDADTARATATRTVKASRRAAPRRRASARG